MGWVLENKGHRGHRQRTLWDGVALPLLLPRGASPPPPPSGESDDLNYSHQDPLHNESNVEFLK